jgi:TolB-like protein
MLALLSVSLVALFTQSAYAAVKFARTYGGAGNDHAFSVQRTSDGGYIVAGYTSSFGAGGYDAFLVKTDANGNLIWAKTYGGASDDGALSVQQTSDGGYIVTGGTGPFGNVDAFLIKTDAFGNIQWAKTYGGTNIDAVSSFQQTSDGGYIVAGWTSSFGAGNFDIFLIRTDASGNIIWAKTYGETDDDWASSVQHTSDGGYIVAGVTLSFGAGGDIFLIKTDANGNLQWAKTYGGTFQDGASSVQQTSDGGYIVAGYTVSFGAGESDIFLIKTDASGNIIWAKTYGGTNTDEVYSVQQTSDGGYIVAGATYSFGAGGDIFLVKTDENGDIGSCGIVGNASPTVGTPSLTVTTPTPSISSISPTVNSVYITVTSPTPTVHEPCFLSISESCQITSGIITPYKGGIKITKSGEFEVKVYNVSGVMVKSMKGKDEVRLELSRGVYFVEVVSGGKVLREKVVIR